MRVFIAAPYSQLCDENYILKRKYKSFFVNLTSQLTDLGCKYFLAHEREKWGKNYSSAEESTLIDFNTIKDSDVVIVIPGSPISGGVHVEVGWASSFNRKMIMFLKKNCSYSPMILGLSAIADVDYYEYDDDLSNKLCDSIIDKVRKYKDKIERDEKNEL